MVFLLALVSLFASFAFSFCPEDLPVSLEVEAKVTDKVGKLYRRADVFLFIPFPETEVYRKSLPLQVESSIEKAGDSTFIVTLKIRNISSQIVEEAKVEQKIESSKFYVDSIKAKRIISKSPYIFEFVNLYPTDIKEDTLVIKLPSLKPSDELEVLYSIRTEGTVHKPRVSGVPGRMVTRKRKVYMLVGKYSLLFGYGRTSTDDINLQNISYVLKSLKAMNIKPVLKVVGIADGKASSPHKNSGIAKKRALFVAKKILGKDFACYTDSFYAFNE